VVANDPDKTLGADRAEADFRAVHAVIDRAAAHCAEMDRILKRQSDLLELRAHSPTLPVYSLIWDEYDEVEYGGLPANSSVFVIPLSNNAFRGCCLCR
jgi:hypothetical protein